MYKVIEKSEASSRLNSKINIGRIGAVLAKNNEENDREIGYSYNWARQRQKRDYENIEKAVKMKKRIDKVLGKKKVLRRK